MHDSGRSLRLPFFPLPPAGAPPKPAAPFASPCTSDARSRAPWPPQHGRHRVPRRHHRPSTADAGRPGGAAALARAAPWALREPLQGRRQATRRRHRSGTGQASGRSTGAPLRVGLNDRPCLVVSSSSPATAPLGRWPLPRRVTSATGSGEWPLRQHVLPPLYTPVASTASVAAVFAVGLPLHLRQPPCFAFSIPLRTQARLSGAEGGLAVPPPPWIL